MRWNNRKPNILEIISFLMLALALLSILGRIFFVIVGLAKILIKFLIQHYDFVLLGIAVCLPLAHCIYCIKQIKRKPVDKEGSEHGTGHKLFLLLHCVLDIICLVTVITVALNVIIHSIKTTSRQTAETQTNVSEYLTEPAPEISLDRTVYVSRSGHKIHLHSDCSGMMYYVSMTYEEACEAGYEHCSRCFD